MNKMFTIIQFCTCILLIFLPLFILEPFIDSVSIFWLKPLLVLIFGFGGIGIYLIVGDKIRDVELKYRNKNVN